MDYKSERALLCALRVNTDKMANPQNKESTKHQTSRAKQILSAMSLQEKVHEMSGNGIWPTVKGMMFKGHVLPVKAGGSQKHALPSISFTDGPRGVAVAKSTSFPVTMARGASWDIELEKRIGEVMGIEARAAGANYSGAVCVNQLRHPAWGRAQETYGEDSWLLGEMGGALVKGIQQHNVMACVKHFALNNIENNRFHVDVQADERTLREVYLPHFKKCIDAGAATVMSAYNKFRGEYCGHSHYLLIEILRNEWGFTGFVTSDWLWGLKDTRKGILAGMHIEMPGAKYYTFKKVKKLLDKGDITMQDIDRLVLPVIQTKLEWAERKDTQDYPASLLASDSHTQLARETAEKSMVLLKNRDALLPLNQKNIRKLAIVGSAAKTPNDGDRASSKVVPPYIVSPFEGISNYVDSNTEILYASENRLEDVKAVCKEADAVVIIAAYNHKEEGEFIHLLGGKGKPGKKPILAKIGMLSNGDRNSLELPERDLKVIEKVTEITNKAIVCLVGGSAITMESWKEKAGAILMTFYGGMEGGNALTNLLFGEVNPSGKLPFTIPEQANDLPFFDPYCDSIEYGYYHGYALMDKKGKKPAFPFGFGLSYTQFSYANLQVHTPLLTAKNNILKLNITVSNTGKVAGEEVTQLYIGFEQSKIDRPLKLLRGFRKTHLHPSEEKTISFEVSIEDLALYNPEDKTWQIEHMEYTIYVGGSSVTEQLLKGYFRVDAGSGLKT
ncbi:MAG: glycosyl hydrolase [Chitinophagaceae bacterium]|nr:MAG: glycosyl hydrolase [Chitinophagaceae bacterium]